VPAGELDPWARHVVGSVREAVGVSALAFGPLGSREQVRETQWGTLGETQWGTVRERR
jgi:hypothetical protein